MKEENKYYTPEIEEFYVGFEFEYYLNTREWCKEIFGEKGIYDLQAPEITKSHIRVKYLDRQDIEKLGWKWYGGLHFLECGTVKYNGGTDGFRQNGFELHYGYDTLTAYVTVGRNKNEKQLFEGKIKNKAELRKLMKQIGIAK